MAFVRSLYELYQRALGEMAERWIGSGSRAAFTGRPVALFLAERLIELAIGATFIVAPVSILGAGTALPGTYGAAVAVALVFVAVPFLALGWLATSRGTWQPALFALAAWAALSGSMAQVSPVLAATCGAILFFVVFSSRTTKRLEAYLAASAGDVSALNEKPPALQTEIARLHISRDGSIRSVCGTQSEAFSRQRSFIDHVHIADRIGVMSAIAAVKADAPVHVTARFDLSKRGQPQIFDTVRLAIANEAPGLKIAINATEAQSLDQDSGADARARQRFLATVSHELRTPLNSIIGFSDILRRDLFGALANDRQREYVNLIHSSGNHLLSIVNTILDVSKLDAGTYSIHREAFDLNRTVGECVSMLMPQAAQKELRVEADLASEIVEADGDRRAIRQVVINLLSNAIKFTAKAGTVRVATSLREKGYQIRVSDDGIGMDGDELSLIGNPFVQADNVLTRTCEGTGLGLTVVKGLVSLHGGTVDIRSEPGKGTEVTVYIPAQVQRRVAAIMFTENAKEKTGDRRTAEQGGSKGKENTDAIRLAG